MSDNPGLDAIIQSQINDFLSDPTNIPQGVYDAMTQYNAMNPVPVQATSSPSIIATGVGSSSNTPTRYVGGTTSGAPTSGTYVAGDFVVSHDGHVYVCTARGTPGTWTTWAAQGEIGYDEITAPVNVASTSSVSPTTIIAGSANTYPAGTYYIEAYAPLVLTPSSSAGDSVSININTGIAGKFVTSAAVQMGAPFYFQNKITLTAGSHTFNMTAFASSTTGTPSVQAGDGQAATHLHPAFIRTRYA